MNANLNNPSDFREKTGVENNGTKFDWIKNTTLGLASLALATHMNTTSANPKDSITLTNFKETPELTANPFQPNQKQGEQYAASGATANDGTSVDLSCDLNHNGIIESVATLKKSRSELTDQEKRDIGGENNCLRDKKIAVLEQNQVADTKELNRLQGEVQKALVDAKKIEADYKRSIENSRKADETINAVRQKIKSKIN